MKPQIPWLRVFVEGVVIVGSILLAFGIDAWWEGRQEREREATYLSALVAEVERNRVIFGKRRDVAARKLELAPVIVPKIGRLSRGFLAGAVVVRRDFAAKKPARTRRWSL